MPRPYEFGIPRIPIANDEILPARDSYGEKLYPRMARRFIPARLFAFCAAYFSLLKAVAHGDRERNEEAA
jgi:hypothetical protein